MTISDNLITPGVVKLYCLLVTFTISSLAYLRFFLQLILWTKSN